MATEEQGSQTATREGGFGRVVGAVVSPRATFESIARKPGWLVPVLLLIIVNLLLTFSFFHRGGLLASMEKQAQSNPAYAQMTPEQRQESIQLAMRFAPIGAYASAVLGTPITLLVIAAIFLGVFNIAFGTGIKFGQSFAVSSYAAVPSLLKSLLALLMVWARPPGGASLQSVSMSNLGAYLPASAPMWLTAVGYRLDVFTLWTIGLLAVGYAAASAKKVRFGSALAVVLGIWVVYLLIVVGATAMIPRA